MRCKMVFLAHRPSPLKVVQIILLGEFLNRFLDNTKLIIYIKNKVIPGGVVAKSYSWRLCGAYQNPKWEKKDHAHFM